MGVVWVRVGGERWSERRTVWIETGEVIMVGTGY
jgi:hypothetical protein